MENNKEFSFAIHEIKNKLQVLILNAEILEKYVDKKNYDDIYLKKFVKRMREESHNLYKFIINISYIFKRENNIEEFNFYQFLNGVIDNFKILIKEKKINLITRYDLNVQNVVGDRKKLEIIISNILKNSLELKTKKNEILLSVEKEGEKIHISITNYGEEIPNKIRDKIFEPGFSTKDEGTGLGLYIVKELTNHINGQIYLNSDRNSTTFTLIIPEDLKNYEKNTHS